MHNKVKITSVPVRLAFLLLYGKHPWLEMVGDRVVIHDTYAAYMACALRKSRFMDGLTKLQQWGVVGRISSPAPRQLIVQVHPPAHMSFKAPNIDAIASKENRA